MSRLHRASVDTDTELNETGSRDERFRREAFYRQRAAPALLPSCAESR